LPLPAGRLLFRPEIIREQDGGIHILDNSVFRKNVWEPAREACGLAGDESLPELDARRNPIKIKDLRAFAASVFTDAVKKCGIRTHRANNKANNRNRLRSI
jgi:hypothetical protein